MSGTKNFLLELLKKKTTLLNFSLAKRLSLRPIDGSQRMGRKERPIQKEVKFWHVKADNCVKTASSTYGTQNVRGETQKSYKGKLTVTVKNFYDSIKKKK